MDSGFMRKLLCIAIAFVSGSSGSDEKQGKIVDVRPTIDGGMCNALWEAGSKAGEKCTWIVDALMPQYVGHIGCTVDGTAVAGESCSFGAPGETGFDNCKAGFVCGNYAGGTGECKQICDQQGGVPMCDAQHVCVTYSGLFSTGDTTRAACAISRAIRSPTTTSTARGRRPRPAPRAAPTPTSVATAIRVQVRRRPRAGAARTTSTRCSRSRSGCAIASSASRPTTARTRG